jgi:hypothetical protein
VRNYKIICHQISNQCNNQALVIQLLLANLLRVNLLVNHRLNFRICNTNQWIQWIWTKLTTTIGQPLMKKNVTDWAEMIWYT